MRAGVTAQTFAILLTLAGFLVLARGDNVDIIDRSPAQNIVPRQASASGSAAAPANTSPAAAPSTTPTQVQTSQAPATSAAPASSAAQPQQSSTQQSSAPQQQSSSQAAAASSTNNNKPSNTAGNSAEAPTTITSALVTTNPAGQVVTSFVVVADTPSPSPSQSSASDKSGGGDSSGVSTSTIVGLSVAGGVAVLCVIGFFVWKFTRKRIGAYDNNEEIKWPELNAHDTSVPLPTHRTGGSGFDTTLDARRSSIGYAPSANSTTELPPDPYAIPPLPHLDPNQPYRDDPNSAYYDPYRGPVPQSFNPAVGPGEVIPMTQLAGTGRRSPGPGAAYAGDFVSGRASPGPGRVSPAPGLHAAYGSNDFGGRASPGPRAAQQGRSMSPGPQAAFGNVYNPR